MDMGCLLMVPVSEDLSFPHFELQWRLKLTIINNSWYKITIHHPFSSLTSEIMPAGQGRKWTRIIKLSLGKELISFETQEKKYFLFS